jgi:cytochrome c556
MTAQRWIAWLILTCLILGITLALSAQNRSHDRIMQDIAPVFSSLKKNIDAKQAVEAAQDAAKLASLFKEVESFWTPLKSGIAIKAAKDVQDIGQKIAAAATSDFAQANTLYENAGAKCKSCHDRHRTQLPDGSYRILP